mmetsp:Transcript_12490/g.23791  ORF Transcript_12490/g.23791 Transcript_12490/m.23791 type:complete len:215 (-) Transcript_12490:131-775(-)
MLDCPLDRSASLARLQRSVLPSAMRPNFVLPPWCWLLPPATADLILHDTMTWRRMLLNTYVFGVAEYPVDVNHGERQSPVDHEFDREIDDGPHYHRKHQHQYDVLRDQTLLAADLPDKCRLRCNDVWPNPKSCKIHQDDKRIGLLRIENCETQQKDARHAGMISVCCHRFHLRLCGFCPESSCEQHGVGVVQEANQNIEIEEVGSRRRRRRYCR